MNWLLRKFLGRRDELPAEPELTPELDERIAEAERQRIDSIHLRAEAVVKAARNERRLQENHFAMKFEQAWRRRHV
jgi:hypothetical protein